MASVGCASTSGPEVAGATSEAFRCRRRAQPYDSRRGPRRPARSPRMPSRSSCSRRGRRRVSTSPPRDGRRRHAACPRRATAEHPGRRRRLRASLPNRSGRSTSGAAAPADVAVVDEANLYVALRLEPSRWGLSRGLLLRSADGGTTWSKTPLPAGGDIAFPTELDGWLSGGLAHERLYATHNRGKTWKQVKPPAAITGAASTAYGLPTFSSATEGVLPVSLAAGPRSTLAFETTSDGG